VSFGSQIHLRSDGIYARLCLLARFIRLSLRLLSSTSPTMPPHKLKDPFHKFKEKLSKYLEHSTSPNSTLPKATSSFLGLGKRSEPPAMSETTSQSGIGRSSSQKMFPKELAPDLAMFNNIFAHLHMQCRSCHAPLSLEIDPHLAAWLTCTQVIPPTSQISVLQCVKCNHSTCIGCGAEPKMNKHNFFTTLGVVRICFLLVDCSVIFGSSYKQY
jgi:hypothetical protein